MAHVNVLLGDLFGQPADLIVIPCSTGPTISPSIYRNLSEYDLPYPTAPMGLGEVFFEEALTIEHIASVVAFAASVDGMSSTENAIIQIGQKLANYCNDNTWIVEVSCPILGTGAGGLDRATCTTLLTSAFLSVAQTSAILNIYSLGEIPGLERNGNIIIGRRGTGKSQLDLGALKFDNSMSESPRVFLSYSQTNDKHKKWVGDFAKRLYKNGVTARVDQFHLRRGEDLAHWMNRELELADKVIMVCDEKYLEKYESRNGGASWEATMILGDLYRHQKSNRHVAIQVGTEMISCVPEFMRNRFNFVAKDGIVSDTDFHELLEFVFDIEPETPALGRPPASIISKLKRVT